MNDRSDSKNSCLSSLVGGKDTDDLERKWLQSHVGGPPLHINDLWLRYFWLNGVTALDYNDAAYEYLEGLGYSGEIDDMWTAYWSACPISAGPLGIALDRAPSFTAGLDKQARDHMNEMAKRKAAQENIILAEHKRYDEAGIPRGLSLEDRHRMYADKGFCPSIRLERVSVVESEYQPPKETSSVTKGIYGALALGFKETIQNMVFSCEGGEILAQPNLNRVEIQTESGADKEFTLTCHATSSRHEAKGTETFTHRHRELQAPVVTIEQVEAGENGYRPPNKTSKAIGTYRAKTEHFKVPLTYYEWAAENGEIISGQGTDTVQIQTDGKGEVDFILHCVVHEVYSTGDYTHQHPKLESFAVLRRKAKAKKSDIQAAGTG